MNSVDVVWCGLSCRLLVVVFVISVLSDVVGFRLCFLYRLFGCSFG